MTNTKRDMRGCPRKTVTGLDRKKRAKQKVRETTNTKRDWTGRRFSPIRLRLRGQTSFDRFNQVVEQKRMQALYTLEKRRERQQKRKKRQEGRKRKILTSDDSDIGEDVVYRVEREGHRRTR
ncbi:hypothetical protein MATL_G00250910 [Megalops atlanticus]|uniref:Uncharacterized protein n=1 Tax=Megalops atlanticus TaxID=7932 RepID=A0A9D3PD32_MEGAT|nr:hypothetical protein MATL_G00250910 [Megalops atlanticus]